jgi:hypothetical protein
MKLRAPSPALQGRNVIARGEAPGYHITPLQGCRTPTPRPHLRAKNRRVGGVEEVIATPCVQWSMDKE